MIKTIVVDDERWMLVRFEEECKGVEAIELVEKFNNPLKALDFARENVVELAFLDISMPGMTGLTLSDKLRAIYPDIIIIFISAHDKYMVEAFRDKGADYFIMKPYTSEDIRSVIERAKLLSVRQKKTIYIETFGRFNIYKDGKFIRFTSAIAKEILALLVDKRGTALGNKEAFYTIWEDRAYDHQTAASYRKGLRKLRDTLDEAGIRDILISSGREHRLDITKFDCDYYQFLEGEPEAIQKFRGEYMLDYSWGEETTATLSAMTNIV